MPETEKIMFNFPTKPASWICDFLKCYGFKWHFIQKLWYADVAPLQVWARDKAVELYEMSQLFPAPLGTSREVAGRKN